MKLDIEIEKIDNPLVRPLAKRLFEHFSPGSQNDISDAVVLSCYLYALDNKKEAIKLLLSFLYYDYEDKPESQRHLWVDNCEGILLLAFIQASLNQDSVKYDLDYIMGKDSQVNPKKFMKDDLKYAIKSNRKLIEYAKTETPKNQCLTYAQQALHFIRILLLWSWFGGRYTLVGFKPIKKSDIEEILKESLELLRTALESRANKALKL